jgi:hypothetical protein
MYNLELMVDDEWLDILSTISRHQDGFVWLNLESDDPEDSVCCHCGN